MASFAEKQLQKYGWKQGEGLGLKKSGISKPIIATQKLDSAGIGKVSDEYSFEWWDHIYNKSAASLTVTGSNEDNLETVKVAMLSNEQIVQQERGLLYNSFVKSGQIPQAEKNYSIPITNDDLFSACGGRTGYKGARGLKSNQFDGKGGCVSLEEPSPEDIKDIDSNIGSNEQQKRVKKASKKTRSRLTESENENFGDGHRKIADKPDQLIVDVDSEQLESLVNELKSIRKELRLKRTRKEIDG